MIPALHFLFVLFPSAFLLLPFLSCPSNLLARLGLPYSPFAALTLTLLLKTLTVALLLLSS